jgi:DNA-directed RNA polymerase specialized sigma24 family protein
MPDARRAVVELRIQGLSQKEIARQLGCTVWNVDYHMTLARRELEKTYG